MVNLLFFIDELSAQTGRKKNHLSRMILPLYDTGYVTRILPISRLELIR